MRRASAGGVALWTAGGSAVVWLLAAPDPSQAAATVERPHTLTLEAAVDEGLRLEAGVQADAESLRQAQADLDTASRPPNPTLSYSKTLMPLGTPYTPQLQGGPPQADLGVAYPLDWLLFGKRSAAVTSAKAGVEEARQGHADFVRRRKADVAIAFLDVLEARDLLELARADTGDLEHIQSIADQRAAVGGAAPVEVDRIRVGTLEARREVRRREGALRVARSALAALLGRTGPEAEFEVEGSLEAAPPSAAPGLEELLAAAEESRPDVAARRRAVDRAAADVQVARKTAWPELTPRIGYTRQYQESIGYPDASSWGFGVEVSVPVFDRNQGNIGRAVSVQSQRELELRAGLAALRAEVQQALSDYVVAREAAIGEDVEQLEAARSVRERVRSAYELGGRPLLEVLDAERVYREASRQSVSGRATLLRALHRLNAAIGREVVR